MSHSVGFTAAPSSVVGIIAAFSNFMTSALMCVASSYAAAAFFVGCLIALSQSKLDQISHKLAEKPRPQSSANSFDDAQAALLQKWRHRLSFPSFNGFEFQQDTATA
jgi:hypothetical protein